MDRLTRHLWIEFHTQQGSLDTLHWNETLGGYFDFGLHSEDGVLDETVRPSIHHTQPTNQPNPRDWPCCAVLCCCDVLCCAERPSSLTLHTTHGNKQFPVRCGDPNTLTAVEVRISSEVLYAWDPKSPDAAAEKTPCPPDYPVVVGLLSQTPQLSYVRGHTFPQHVPRVGYVGLFPFLLGLLPADSPRLGPVLDTLRDPEQLWSPYGIRSLSKADPYYAMENAPGTCV